MTTSKKILLGFQHLFAMFGATVLVPKLTGLNPAVALFTAGIGTLIFHLVTKRKVPVFLGSSFAFIPAFQMACINNNPELLQLLRDERFDLLFKDPRYLERIPYALGGVMAAGLVFMLLSLCVKLFGPDLIRSLFPPIVTGPIIVVIGLTLAPSAMQSASVNWIIAIITLLVVIITSVFAKGFFKLVPVLIGIASGYIVSILFDLIAKPAVPFIDFASIKSASWISPIWDFSGTFFVLPKFELGAIILIAPIALVVFMEHIGDITINGTVVGKDFIKDPGLHRTLLGDGIATFFAGLLGGPASTTYAENTGVLAVTKVYDPFILRLAACFSIILGLFGKFGAILQTIPAPVLGGVSILLFGMIASIGMRTIAESKVDFSQSRNFITVALILVIGIGLSGGVSFGTFHVSGLFLAVIIGVAANAALPKEV
ncbi:MAG: uracil permease [Oscillospiraceae bacterium]|nr:uracil permease [Oscillospiraceae bacterium]